WEAVAARRTRIPIAVPTGKQSRDRERAGRCICNTARTSFTESLGLEAFVASRKERFLAVRSESDTSSPNTAHPPHERASADTFPKRCRRSPCGCDRYGRDHACRKHRSRILGRLASRRERRRAD